MQFRIRAPIIFGLLIACCLSSADAQINSGYFVHCAKIPVAEPYYDPQCYTTGCYRDPGTCWLGEVTFDVLLFSRSDADSRTIVAEVGTGDPLLNTTDLGFPVTAGFRVNVVLPCYDGCDLVFNYLGSNFVNSRVHRAANATYDFFEFPTLTPETGTDFQTSYRSSLASVEIGSRLRQWSRFAPLAGLRFIHLADHFDRMSGDGSADLQTSQTDNSLWGFQIGGEGLLWDSGTVRLQSTVKGGVFYNDLKLSTGGGAIVLARDPVTNAVLSSFDPTGSFSAGHTSYFGEVNLELSYQCCPQFSIRVGYTAMWLDGAALAPDQHDNFNLQSRIGAFDYGTVLFHGSYVGFEAAW